jgi:hypothetical protein
VGSQLGLQEVVWVANRSAGLLVGRTHLSGTAVSLVGGNLGVPMSHKWESKKSCQELL